MNVCLFVRNVQTLSWTDYVHLPTSYLRAVAGPHTNAAMASIEFIRCNLFLLKFYTYKYENNEQ